MLRARLHASFSHSIHLISNECTVSIGRNCLWAKNERRKSGMDLGEETMAQRPTKAHLGNGESGAPLFLQDVQADAALAVDVGVVQLGLELHLGWLERIVRGKVNAAHHTTPLTSSSVLG